MAEKYNATCSICGRPYYKCISCKDAMALNPWKILCCSAHHYQVHQVIKGWNSGVYTKNEAKNKLKNIGISDVEIENFRPHIKQIVKNIFKEDEVVKEVETNTISRKRNYKVNKIEVNESVEDEVANEVIETE